MIKYLIIILLTIYFSSQLFSQEIPSDNFFGKDLISENKINFIDQKEIKFLKELGVKVNNYSQNDNILIDSITSLKLEGYKGKITVEYNDKNKINSLIFYILFDSLCVKNWRLIYTYDSFGRISTLLNESWTGYFWENYSIDCFEYNSNNNIISELMKYWNGSDWENILRITNNYNSDNKIIVSLTEKFENDNWKLESKLTTEYSPNGLRSSILYEDFSNSPFNNNIHTSFFYDESKNLVSIINKKRDGQYWINYLRIIYNYTQNPNQIIQSVDIWNNKYWEKYARYSYQYNSIDYMDYAVFDLWDGHEWRPSDGNIYINNPDGFELHYFANEISVYYNPLSIIKFNENLIRDYKLFYNYPNPFNPSTKINFQLPEAGLVTLKVYDMLGQEVATLVNEVKDAGRHSATFNASHLSSGTYIYEIKVNDFRKTQKMMLVK